MNYGKARLGWKVDKTPLSHKSLKSPRDGDPMTRTFSLRDYWGDGDIFFYPIETDHENHVWTAFPVIEVHDHSNDLYAQILKFETQDTVRFYRLPEDPDTKNPNHVLYASEEKALIIGVRDRISRRLLHPNLDEFEDITEVLADRLSISTNVKRLKNRPSHMTRNLSDIMSGQLQIKDKKGRNKDMSEYIKYASSDFNIDRNRKKAFPSSSSAYGY